MAIKLNDADGSSFELEVAKGNVPGHSVINKFGRNTAVTAAEDIWGAGGDWTQVTSAVTSNFASSSANDTAAGTGARTLTVTGIDGSYNEVTETLTLNGTSNVATANSYWHIHRVLVATAGSGGTAAGTITATATGGGTPVTATIVLGGNQTTQSVYQVPANYTAYLYNAQLCVQSSTANATCDVIMVIKPLGGVFNLKSNFNLGKDGSSVMVKTYPVPIRIPEKSIIKFRCESVSAGSWDISVDYTLILIAN